jgi:hypothetical protein
MVRSSHPRPQISLAAALLSISLFCTTVVLAQLFVIFFKASTSVPGSTGHAFRVLAAGSIIIGAMIGSLTAGPGKALRGAIIGAVVGLCVAMVLILSAWMVWWALWHNHLHIPI